MKKTVLIILVFITSLCYAQTEELQLITQFDDEPVTHNMHIASDGNYYYTINGGVADKGEIHKYSLNGEYIKAFPLKLDTRSIMYNSKDKHFYVSTYTKNIYKITNLETGEYDLIIENAFSDGQSCPAISASGKNLYVFENGEITKIDLASGEKKGTRGGFKGTVNVVAVDEKYVYTWDPANLTIYVQDFSANLIKTLQVAKGAYQFSLSIANGILFTSVDGNYGTGTWYGYKISQGQGFINKKVKNVDPDEPANPGGKK